MKQLSAAIIAAKIEFSKIGLVDSADILDVAENKLHEMVFAPLREMISYCRDSKVNWCYLDCEMANH